MVYLTLNGGTQLLAFNTKEEREEYCEKRGILAFHEHSVFFSKEDKKKVLKNFPFLGNQEVS
jgi:hypothetical protein